MYTLLSAEEALPDNQKPIQYTMEVPVTTTIQKLQDQIRSWQDEIGNLTSLITKTQARIDEAATALNLVIKTDA